jgi:hypothetical protein
MRLLVERKGSMVIPSQAQCEQHGTGASFADWLAARLWFPRYRGSEHFLQHGRNNLADTFESDNIIFGFDGHVIFLSEQSRQILVNAIGPGKPSA